MHIVNQSSVRRTLTTPIYSENTTDHGHFENIEFQRLFFLRLFLIRGPKKNIRSQRVSARLAKLLNTQDLNDKTSDLVARTCDFTKSLTRVARTCDFDQSLTRMDIQAKKMYARRAVRQDI